RIGSRLRDSAERRREPHGLDPGSQANGIDALDERLARGLVIVRWKGKGCGDDESRERGNGKRKTKHAGVSAPAYRLPFTGPRMASRACSRSATRSSTSSIPTEMRTRPGVTPRRLRSVSGI